MSELARRSRWCDQSILDERNSGFSSGPLRGRLSVWNSRRGNHLGQHSCASAPTGRTYGRKRSGQNTANTPCEEGAVHIWVMDMVFRDDECRVRTNHAPANFTTIKHMAHNLLRRPTGKDSFRLRRKVAGWDDAFLASLVTA